MTNEHEKHWQELVEKEAQIYCPNRVISHKDLNPLLKEDLYIIPSGQKGFKAGAQFVRNNLSQLPEVRDAIGVIEAFKVYFETLNEGRHGYAQDKMRGQINDALKKLGGGE